MQIGHHMNWLRKTMNSPEYKQDGHLIFVYGTLKKGFRNSDFMKSAELLTTTQTSSSRFQMVSIGSSFPAVLENGEFYISGEIYRISGPLLRELDILEAHGTFYARKKVNITGVDEPVWMYVLIDKDIGMISPSCPLVFTNPETKIQTWISLDE